ncbi:MAG: type II toxin-antitoxin system PemK/MazF family toxin [Actinomycetota bacterium]|nr:type II toxin-antitoxin system PemK/MazF family toxin [Actinomycetota bacterium]
MSASGSRRGGPWLPRQLWATKGGSVRSETDWPLSNARRGDLWLLDLGDPLGHQQGWQRPALVLSSDRWNEHAETLTVIPLTRTRHGLPTRVELEPDQINQLDEVSYARCEDIRSVSAVRLVHRIGAVDLEDMAIVARTLRTFLEL